MKCWNCGSEQDLRRADLQLIAGNKIELIKDYWCLKCLNSLEKANKRIAKKYHDVSLLNAFPNGKSPEELLEAKP